MARETYYDYRDIDFDAGFDEMREELLRDRFSDRVYQRTRAGVSFAVSRVTDRHFLPEFATGAVAGFAVKTGVRGAASFLGMSGLPAVIGIGAVAGGILAGGREYFRQVRENRVIREEIRENDPENPNNQVTGLQSVLRDLRPNNVRRLVLQSLRGVAIGGVGAFVGFELADLAKNVADGLQHISNPFDQSHAPQPITGLDNPVATPTVDHTVITPDQPVVTSDHPLTTPDQGANTNVAPHVDQAPTLTSVPSEVSLPAGSNTWNESAKLLRDAVGHEPTNAQIMEVDKILCQANKISVPSWGISGEGFISDHRLPVGFKIIIPDSAKSLITSFK